MDILNELRLRRWARENYVPVEGRPSAWDPIVLDEMRMRDDELASPIDDDLGTMLVPLAPIMYFVDPPQLGPVTPHYLTKPATEPLAEAREWGLYLG